MVNDSCICISPTQAINILKSKDSLQIAKTVIVKQDSVIGYWKSLSSNLENIAYETQRLAATKDAIISNLDQQIEKINKENKLTLDYTLYLKKMVRKANKKTIIISGISVSVISGLVYLLTQ